MALNATPKQTALIGVLGVTFLAVAVYQYRSITKSSAPAPTQTVRSASLAQVDSHEETQSTPVPTQHHAEAVAWPKPSLERALGYNPFATLETDHAKLAGDAADSQGPLLDESTTSKGLREAKLDDLNRRLDEIAAQGISAILGSRDRGYVALVGDQELRTGDMIGDIRVRSVAPDGIELEHPLLRTTD